MKIKDIIFFTVMIFIMLSIIGFSYWRNKKRLIKIDEIVFMSGSPKFLNYELINKLLEIELDKISESKESINLTSLESFFETNPYIYNAELYYYPNGSLGISIKEEEPELKIISDTIFYFNYKGFKVPVSKKYKPDLPIFIGNPEKSKIKELLFLVSNFKKDYFLKKELKTIRYESNSYYIKLNSFDFEVEFGSINNLEEKIKKLKVFSAFYNSMKTKSDYKKISLKYNKQVVAS